MDPIFSRPARIFRDVLLGALIVPTSAVAGERTKLFVREMPITVFGREATVMAIVQKDGTPGWSSEQQDGFHVEVVNELNVPTAIHHLATGMFTVLKYDGADTEFWKPERMAQEDPAL